VTPDESALCAIWADVLGVARVGTADDFFELGGHSLIATQVASRVRETLGIELPLRTLFVEPTVASLAREIARCRAEGAARADVAIPARPRSAERVSRPAGGDGPVPNARRVS
jgi:acyl carrier protein